jgi:hypothetical protein
MQRTDDFPPVPSSSQPTGITNTVGRSLTFGFDTYGNLNAVNDGARAVSITGSLSSPSPSASMTDPTGAVTSFAYTPVQATSDTQRPVPFVNLNTITTADDPSTPNIEYDYDALGEVAQVKDAEALQVGDRNPYLFLIADGTRGERDDPLGGAYSVTFDTYGHPSLYTDELGRITTALIDSRSRPVTYTYPEGDCELFVYDDHNNTTQYARIDKTGNCQNVAGSHRILTIATWNQTWNKPLTITSPNSNVTHFTYNSSGNGISLLATATRPADGDGN